MSVYGFGAKTLLMLVIPVALAAIILAVAGKRGTSVFKKQGVAWGLTVLMVFAAIGIGYAKSPANSPAPEPGLQQGPGQSPYIWDNANVLSDRTLRELDQRNERLWRNHSVVIGVVSCNYGRDDLDRYTIEQFENMDLGGYDMLVVLDISGDNYWLYTGDSVAWDFSDEDCSDYTYDYMERSFAKGDYDNAVLSLTQALETWYGDYYG